MCASWVQLRYKETQKPISDEKVKTVSEAWESEEMGKYNKKLYYTK